MDFLQQLGPVALGSRLRRLSEYLTGEATSIYADYGLSFQPRWYPVFYLIAHRPGISSNEIAEQIGHTHASVSQIVKELVGNGLLAMTPDRQDQRRRLLALTPLGHEVLPQLRAQTDDVRRSMQALLDAAEVNLWQALDRFELQLQQQSLRQRVADARHQRTAAPVQLRDFRPGDQPVFRQLNEEWISRYFKLEPADLKALDHPEEYILEPGGCILLAELNGQVVGTCALIKMEDGHSYELAKMAVSPAAQGQQIGFLLGQAAVQRVRDLSGTRVYLESNAILKPALALYRKLGFQDLAEPNPSPYARADVQMELLLS
ncbi:bifunctional helix-turn-helix transcriptional regulator/GNAT family N-acetyltransferase [Hymenobacter properus]|uniref:Bifunctional helix-turn-helix transcriptional regulator/GNAT family N-acetyltransferase n=1 Tax=Hymenobacter properus TaxID=2791026 RepID=A0A931FN64_9BACT|nr:bifunctional helix-turn-helix transcriptional regulator/GNAT family N-acetyltransferase [Hymenobacter properus]MBF9143791.1 bifunctional helix-turn-helix transcriptional regulator/GNAT family N-acetyltransferase [Hymenobacter properus]MBR7722604.1 bifunctional helix-turn-helix transcriptional regulator/GNAT family N-acetyltransferase [Microvirga sp. SRT04]